MNYKKGENHIAEYLLPALIAGALFMIILALNGLWPFGRETIDYYDMAQWSDLFYYHNYDELRGAKSLVYDWYLNLGRQIPGLSEPSLFDLLMYLVPRRYFLECSSLLLCFKIMAAAFFMGIFVRYINKDLPYVFRVILSAGYGLCGFVMTNYTVPQWIDMAALVPLVLMFSQKALREGRFVGLSVTTFLIMIDDYYFGVQMMMFVFLTGGAYCTYLFFSGRKKELAEDLFVRRLLLGIVLGLGLSSFSWIPDVAFNATSARFGNGTSGNGIIGSYFELLSNTTPAYLSRWFSLLGLSFPAALTASGLIDRAGRKEWKNVIFRLSLIFMITAQLVLESVHLLLHFGSYVDYPVRNGFMIWCIMAGLAACSYPGADESGDDKRPHLSRIACGIIATAVAAAAFKIWYSHNAGISDHTVFLISMSLMTILAFIHLVLIRTGEGKHKSFCPYLWMAEVLIFGIIMIGKPLYDTPYGHDPEQEGEYIRISDQLTEKFAGNLTTGKTAATRRIKNPDTSLNANYGLIMQRETLSGWTNLATGDQIGAATDMGYSSQFTRLLDSGGNIFFDTLIHVTDLVSFEELDDRLYQKVASAEAVTDHMTGETREYHLYKNRFEMPFAIPVKGAPEASGGPAALINSFAKECGAKTDMAATIDTAPSAVNEDDHEISSYTIDVKGNKALYFAGSCIDTDYYNTKITVNGKTVPVPSIKEEDNELFPAHFNNNTVELGAFENESVNVVIDMDVSDPEEKYEYIMYEIDLDVLADLCQSVPFAIEVSQGKRSLDITLPDLAPEYKGVLIPVSYSSGWSASVDGKTVIPQKVNGLFMYVPTNGGRVIHMSYFPPMMFPGIITALVFAIIAAAVAVSDKKKKPAPAGADRVLAFSYCIGFAAAFAVLYVTPFAYALLLKCGLS